MHAYIVRVVCGVWCACARACACVSAFLILGICAPVDVNLNVNL